MAQIELKTKPDCKAVSRQSGTEGMDPLNHTACSVDKTGRGRVVIWIVLPAMFATTNMSIPSLKRRVSQMSHVERHATMTNLPSPSSVRRPARIIGVFLILQNVRLSLQCEPQRLDRGGDESNEDTYLKTSVINTTPSPATCPEDLLQRYLAAKGHQADPYYRIGTLGARSFRVNNHEVFNE